MVNYLQLIAEILATQTYIIRTGATDFQDLGKKYTLEMSH
jgi:hypothetical protein